MNSGDFKPLTNDLCFKYVFSKRIILEDFINSFLEFINSKERFKFTSIIPEKFIMPNNKKYSLYFGDIVANTLIDEITISLEMYKNNFTKENYNKSYAYMCRLFDKSIINNNYNNAKKIYSINLIKGNFRKINNELVNIYNFKNEKGQKIDKGNTEMFLIRFDKVKNIPYNKHEKRFITWLRIINSESYEEIRKYSEGDEIMSESDKFIAQWCRESNKNGFERYVKEREVEAAEKAEKQGILKTAKNLISLNIDLKDIKKATGLTEKELNKLKKSLLKVKRTIENSKIL